MSKRNRIKLIFLIFVFIVVGAFSLIDNPLVGISHAESRLPPVEHSGAPGERDCSRCHKKANNPPTGQFVIIAPETYEPAKLYQITVNHITDDSTRRRWGFEITALNKQDSMIGRLSSPTNLLSNIGIFADDLPGAFRSYIVHNESSTFMGQTGGASWTFNWRAPGRYEGPAILYAAGVQADGDGTKRGDQAYLTEVRIQPADIKKTPRIISANVISKILYVNGEFFDVEAKLLINGVIERRTETFDSPPGTQLKAYKINNKIAPGQTVTLQIMNEDGTMSEPFLFTRAN